MKACLMATVMVLGLYLLMYQMITCSSYGGVFFGQRPEYMRWGPGCSKLLGTMRFIMLISILTTIADFVLSCIGSYKEESWMGKSLFVSTSIKAFIGLIGIIMIFVAGSSGNPNANCERLNDCAWTSVFFPFWFYVGVIIYLCVHKDPQADSKSV
eukprot:TRINITY_DN10224_c0_g1_i1.p2 TRINITY_DN10224_c0_g1~~TRINITY_DN10224_c0_g1_i1.p2  ORF type:complete len:155 (-),score=31.78 TRINITY_DN10224_c0_g1_i1:112-576(-)